MSDQLAEMIEGRTYFIVMFDDEDLRIPVVQTLIFLHEGKRADGSEYYLFREVGKDDEEARFFVNREDAASLLLNETMLLTKLRKCFDGDSQ